MIGGKIRRTMKENKAKKELKVVIQREINCYLHNSYFLCIILAYKNMYPWFYENYVQLYYNPDKFLRFLNIKEVWFDFYGGYTEPRRFLACRRIHLDDLKQVNILNFIKECIDSNCYLYTYIDEYYTRLQGKYHFVHDIFIYGYDEEDQKILVIGFDSKMNFTNYGVDFDQFKTAFDNGVQMAKLTDQWKGANYCLVIEPKLEEDYRHKFEMDNFLTALSDYLNSTNKNGRKNPHDTNYAIYQGENNVYGINTYDKLIECIRHDLECSSGDERLDFRPFHVFYEHKRQMRKRMEFLYTALDAGYKPKLTDLITRCKNLEEVFNIIRLKSMKCVCDRDKQVLNEIISSLKTQKKIEFDLLGEIYQLLAIYKGEKLLF